MRNLTIFDDFGTPRKPLRTTLKARRAKIIENRQIAHSRTRKSRRVLGGGPKVAPLLWENSLGEKVPEFSKTRALWEGHRTLSETSVPHLVVFLKYFDTSCLIPNGPVCDVYYYTSRPLGQRGKSGAPEKGRDLYSARFARSARQPLQESTGAAGGCVVVRHFGPLWHSARFATPRILRKIFKKMLLKTL